MRTILSGTMIVLVVVVIGLSIVIPIAKAGYDHIDRPATAQDCIDAIMPIPTATAKQFGNTDKTRLVFNIAELLNAVSGQEARIKALEKQVAELQEPTTDPNEVEK